MGQDDLSGEALCLAQAETIWGWPIKVDLSNFGNEWTECIDQERPKVLEERRKGVGKLP